MPRSPRPWFRMYTETFSDRKILRLRPDQRWLWAAMLGAARQSPTPGDLLVAEGLPMTHRELARYADVSVRIVKPTLETMSSLGMVVLDGEVIRLPNFTSRQFESDDVTSRTRAHRERSKERSNAVPKNVRRNTPETETETETETEHPSGVADKPPRAPRKQKSPLPTGWQPSRSSVLKIAEEWPSYDTKRETVRFIDYWEGTGESRADWESVWRNWMRKEAATGRPLRAVGDGEIPWHQR